MGIFFRIIFFSVLLVFLINHILVLTLTSREEVVKTDKELGWDFANYKKKTFNDAGFRINISKDEILKIKKTKIVFLGNSVVAGESFEYSKVFSFLVNDKFGKRSQEYMVLNAGAGGYEIFREFRKYMRDFSFVKPKYVVWFPGINDYQIKRVIDEKILQTLQAQGVKTTVFPENLIAGFNLLAAKIQTWKESQLVSIPQLSVDKHKYYTDPLLNPFSSEISITLESEIKNFKNFLDQQNTELIVAFLPSEFFCKSYSWKDAGSFQQLDKILQTMKIKSISLFDKLPCKDKELYLDFVHFNEIGHEEVAKRLAIELEPFL